MPKGAIRGGVHTVRPPEEDGGDAGLHGAEPPDCDGAGQAGGGDYRWKNYRGAFVKSPVRFFILTFSNFRISKKKFFEHLFLWTTPVTTHPPTHDRWQC